MATPAAFSILIDLINELPRETFRQIARSETPAGTVRDMVHMYEMLNPDDCRSPTSIYGWFRTNIARLRGIAEQGPKIPTLIKNHQTVRRKWEELLKKFEDEAAHEVDTEEPEKKKNLSSNLSPRGTDETVYQLRGHQGRLNPKSTEKSDQAVTKPTIESNGSQSVLPSCGLQANNPPYAAVEQEADNNFYNQENVAEDQPDEEFQETEKDPRLDVNGPQENHGNDRKPDSRMVVSSICLHNGFETSSAPRTTPKMPSTSATCSDVLIGADTLSTVVSTAFLSAIATSKKTATAATATKMDHMKGQHCPVDREAKSNDIEPGTADRCPDKTGDTNVDEKKGCFPSLSGRQPHSLRPQNLEAVSPRTSLTAPVLSMAKLPTCAQQALHPIYGSNSLDLLNDYSDSDDENMDAHDEEDQHTATKSMEKEPMEMSVFVMKNTNDSCSGESSHITSTAALGATSPETSSPATSELQERDLTTDSAMLFRDITASMSSNRKRVASGVPEGRIEQGYQVRRLMETDMEMKKCKMDGTTEEHTKVGLLRSDGARANDGSLEVMIEKLKKENDALKEKIRGLEDRMDILEQIIMTAAPKSSQ